MLKVGSTSPVEDFQALVADAAVTFGEGCYLHYTCIDKTSQNIHLKVCI